MNLITQLTTLIMSQPKFLICAVVPLLTLAAPAFGSVYYTDFTGYSTASDLAGQDGWSINDPTANVSGLQNLGGEWGSRAAYLGFATPSVSSVFVSHAVSTPMVDTVGNVNGTFSALFRVIDSDSNGGLDSSNRDTFGFKLENAAGDNLFSFHLIPFAQVASPELNNGFHTYAWSTGNNSPTAVLPSVASAEENAPSYLFSVSFSQGVGSDVNFTASVGNQSFGGVIPNSNTETITKIGAFMNAFSTPATTGSNYMNFDNVSLIPEPSSALLGLLGASFALGRRRRA